MANTENTLKNEIRELPDKPEKKEKPGKKGKKKRAKKESKPLHLSLGINERVVKITGLLLISASLFITLAMGSFLFSWQTDQSMVSNLDWDKLSTARPEMTRNWMGLFGAWISHLLIFRWFGVASFLFAPVLFLTGFRWLFSANNIPLARVYSLAAISILFFSVLFGFLFNTLFISLSGGRFSYMGGAFGYETNLWFSGLVGAFGVAILLIIAFLSYLILAFNITFRVPKFLAKKSVADGEEAVPFDTAYEPMQGNIYEPDAGVAGADEEEDDIDPEEFKLVVLPEKKQRSPADLLKEKPSGIDFQVKTASPIGATMPAVAAVPQETRFTDGSWYKYPTLDLLRNHEIANAKVDNLELEERKNLIVETLENYKIKIDKIEATIGPTVTLYEIVPAAGIRISRIKSLEDDIALSLSALGIRIIAPMPGKGTIGIEVPNQHPQIVSLREALAAPAFTQSTFDLPIVLGKTISGDVFVGDLTKMPHLLMAGATGQGNR